MTRVNDLAEAGPLLGTDLLHITKPDGSASEKAPLSRLAEMPITSGGATRWLATWIDQLGGWASTGTAQAATTTVATISVGGIEFRELTGDALGRPVLGLDVENGIWAAVDGEFVRIGIIPTVDENGRVSFGGDASFTPAVLEEKLVPTIKDYQFLVVDSEDRPVEARDFDGQLWVAIGGSLKKVTSTGVGTAKSYNYSYTTGTAFSVDAGVDYLFIINGQSLAAGAKNGSAGDATITTVAQHPGYALMPSVGVRPNGALFGAYADLHEQDMGGSFETTASGMADVVMSRLQARLGFRPRIVWAIAAVGGQAYWDTTSSTSGLKRGTATYNETLRIIQQSVRISKESNRSLVILGQIIIHGEQDFANGLSKELYGRALDQWNAHINEDWRALTGQASPIRTYLTQVNRGGSTAGSPAGPALAQLAAQDRNPMIRCVGAFYACAGGVPEDGNDGSHLQAIGYRHNGCLIGHFVVEDLFGAYEQPMQVVDWWRVSDTQFDLKMSEPAAIDADNSRLNVIGMTVGSTTYSGLGNGKGIEFTDGTGSPPAITSVVMLGGTTDTIRVTLASAPTGRDLRMTIAALRVGGIGSGAGRGARSAIRSASSFHVDALTSTALYHWACQQQLRFH